MSKDWFMWTNSFRRRSLTFTLCLALSVSRMSFPRSTCCALAVFFSEVNVKYEIDDLTKALPCEPTLKNILKEISVETLATGRKKFSKSKIRFEGEVANKKKQYYVIKKISLCNLIFFALTSELNSDARTRNDKKNYSYY